VELLPISSLLEVHLTFFIACFIVIVIVAFAMLFIAASPFFVLNHLVMQTRCLYCHVGLILVNHFQNENDYNLNDLPFH